MKKVMAWIILALLVAGSASAETITVTDDPAGGGNAYGNCVGFAIDFDTTAPLAATTTTTGWAPALVAGKSYALNSVSMQYGGSVTSGTGIAYLGVYSDMGTTFLGASTNSINFNTTTADTWCTFEFEGINVTVDSTVGSGSGLLYFYYQPAQTSGTGGEISTRRLNYDAAMTQGLASIIAYGTLQGARAPHYKADIGNKDTVFMPHNPAVLPENEGGSSGSLQTNNADVEVTFSFDAAMNAEETAVNPDVLGHYIYLSKGTSDPNLYLLDYVVHSDLNNPSVSYGPMMLVNGAGKTFKWKVEEALNKGAGVPYPAGDPNNIMGNDWNFDAIPATPKVTDPAHTLTDASGNATLTVTTSLTATDVRWYKVVGVKDITGGETDDVMLTNTGIYSGVTTTTLTVTGAASDGSDDAQVYIIAYNGDPTITGTPSATSAAAWHWYPRLVHHYPFEIVDSNSVTPDIVGGLNATLTQEAASAGMPVLNSTNAKVGSSCLELTNADTATDPNGQYAQIPDGVADYLDITVSAWIYPKTNATWARAFDFGSTTTDYIFLAPSTGSVLRFAAKVGNGTEQDLDGTAVLTAGQWSYVTVTITGSTGRLYLNGTLISTSTTMTDNPVDMASTTPQNYIGKSQYTSDPEFDGMIDDLKIYNYARTTVQVAQDYLAVNTGGWVCNKELYDLALYDFNSDCIVDLNDFAMLAATWLESYRIYSN